jgi:hypothetical protein
MRPSLSAMGRVLTAPWLPRERLGYVVWAAAGAVFAIPEIWASKDDTLPFPTLSGTVGHLERRWEIVSLFVIIVIANALLHGVRIGAAVLKKREAGDDDELGATGVETVEFAAGRHVAVEAGRVTTSSRPVYISSWWWIVYFVFTIVLVAAGFLVPLWVHGGHASDTEKQLAGEFGYGAMGLAFFLIPGFLAFVFSRLVPFPAIFQTILSLERRIPILAVVVAGSMTFLMLHLVLYPYPSIIPWFDDLKHLHDHCVAHASELVCTSK